MLTLLIGADWVANTKSVLNRIAEDVRQEKSGRILIVPELISHEMERRLCATAGNTTSRFAEVLTFTRLATRVSEAVGHGLPATMDDGGRVVAMASTTRNLRSKLKAYASVETKPEFISDLVDAVDEFKRCCITSKDLMLASKETDGAFSQKLEELSLILEGYEALCSKGLRDPRDQMSWLLEVLEDSDFAANHTFYIDGFPDYTRQHMEIVKHLMEHSPNVVISINCDRIDTKHLAFEKAADTARDILQEAKKMQIPTQIITVDPEDEIIADTCKKIFQGSIPDDFPGKDRLRAFQSESVIAECTAVADQIIDLIHSGVRFREIAVVCTDIAKYRGVLSMLLQRYHIPCYLSGTEDILDKSVITTVLAALDTVIGGFEHADVIRYLKSPLSAVQGNDCDELENYAITWNITGSNWTKTWENHPNGLVSFWTEADKEQLERLNASRSLVIDPLQRLSKSLADAQNLGQMVAAVYKYLDQICMAQRLEELALQMDAAGDNRSAQVLNQLWEILLGALEQLYDVLGQMPWETESFTRLLKLLLSQYTVGTIPTVLDAVTVGPVSAMRCQKCNYLFVVGAQEGTLPGYGGICGVLTDGERSALRQLGVPLTGGALDGLQAEFAEIYGVFCGARKRIIVSCPDGQPSYIFRRVSELAGGQMTITEPVGPGRVDRQEAAAVLLRSDCIMAADELGLTDICNTLDGHRSYQMGSMEQKTVEALYGHQLRLSASQVDKLADCRLSYFLNYGLRAKERKSAEIDPAEFGSYVHTVLELTGREVLTLGGFRKVSLEEVLSIAQKHSDQYARERFAQLDSQRIKYLFARNGAELQLIVEELWQELQLSQFQPVDFEVNFDKGSQMDAISIEGQTLQALLRGYVDRVDAWSSDGKNYFRVVDYKTGRKDFDYCDVFNGYGLQMLLYLFALSKSGQTLLGENPVPAGVQYFPARVPLVSADGCLSADAAAAERQKLWKRKGLLLEDEQVLSAMEPCEKPVRLNYTRKKDGSISGDLASSSRFEQLQTYVFALLGKMVDDISSGNVEPNPYTRGSEHNACRYCPYGAVCNPEEVPGRRDYQAMNAQKFWEEVDKEVNGRG